MSERLWSRDEVRLRMRRSMLFVLPLQVAYVLVAIGCVVFRVWGGGLAVLLVPALWLPAALEVATRAAIPRFLHGAYMLFLTAGPLAGSSLTVYLLLPGWDKVVHFYSGVLVGWGMLFALARLGILARHGFPVVAFIVQCAVMASAAGWEICEFAADHLLGAHAQLNNLDTMTDIISGTLGGVVMLLLARFARRPKAVTGIEASEMRVATDQDRLSSLSLESQHVAGGAED